MQNITVRSSFNPAQKLGMAIKLARVSLDWSQADLGSRLHVSRDTISRFERGESIPDYLQMQTLAKVLGQPLEYFEV